MSFHKGQKFFGLQSLTPPIIKAPQKMLRFGLGVGGGGGFRRCRKSRAYLWKNPGYAPAKARKNNRRLEKRRYQGSAD